MHCFGDAELQKYPLLKCFQFLYHFQIWNLKQDTSLQEMIGHTKEVTLVEWCPTAPNVIARYVKLQAFVKNMWISYYLKILYNLNKLTSSFRFHGKTRLVIERKVKETICTFCQL